jgi:hypothetical protein
MAKQPNPIKDQNNQFLLEDQTKPIHYPKAYAANHSDDGEKR